MHSTICIESAGLFSSSQADTMSVSDSGSRHIRPEARHFARIPIRGQNLAPDFIVGGRPPWGNPPTQCLVTSRRTLNVPHVLFCRTHPSGRSEHHAPAGMASRTLQRTWQQRVEALRRRRNKTSYTCPSRRETWPSKPVMRVRFPSPAPLPLPRRSPVTPRSPTR